jgi:hypothetical protein
VILLEYPRSDEKTTQKKLVFGSCRLLDSKMEKPTNFEIILPVTLIPLRRTIALAATTPKELLLLAPKQQSLLLTSKTTRIHFWYCLFY